jgi:hypothetical protein
MVRATEGVVHYITPFDGIEQGPVRFFRQKFTLEDAIGSHACLLAAHMRVTNGIQLCPIPLTGWHCEFCPNTEGIYCMAEGECQAPVMAGGAAAGLKAKSPGHAVVRCTWEGEHGWPVGFSTPDFAMQIIYSFFKAHRRHP